MTATIACLLLAGCYPATRGGVGVSVTIDGRPIAVFEPCEGDVNSFEISVVDEIGRRIAPIDQWRYLPGDAPIEYVVNEGLPELGVSQQYQFSGGALQEAWPQPAGMLLEPTWFDYDGLERLSTEQVLYRYFNGESFVTVTGSREAFKDAVCATE